MEDRTVPTGLITEFSTGISAGSGPDGIAAGPDGNLWFTEGNGNRIGRITPQGTVTEFSTGISAGSGPAGITAGPDGNLWFTEGPGGRIGRITPQGTVTEFSSGITPGSWLSGITAGPDGNLWFTYRNTNRIGRITPQGTVTEFSNGITGGRWLGGIAAGPDGNLWFTEPLYNCIGRITPQGIVTEFSNGISYGADGIAAGPDGNLWFTEGRDTSQIGRITPQGTVTEFSNGISGAAGPYGITVGPDGNLWFTEGNGSRIGRITPQGTVTEFSTGITPYCQPQGITVGPDGNIWFTENSANRVATLQLRLQTTTILTTSASPVAYGQPLVLTAAVTNTYSPVIPDGYVTFYDGSTAIGVVTLSGGDAVLSTAGLAAGVPHLLTASYSGSAIDLPSTSPVTTDLVTAATTATTLSAPTSSVVGNPVVLTAAVTNTDSPVIPDGYVTFYDGSTAIGVVTLSGGDASLSTASLGAGIHHLTAVYAGDGNFAGSTSASFDLTINPATTATTLSAPTSSVAGNPVVLTATVKSTNSPAIPDDFVTFYDGSTAIGVATASGGDASLSTASLGVGIHHLTAVYAGNGNFAGSTSTSFDVTINPATTAVNLSASTTSSTAGDLVTLAATVTNTDSPATPLGYVTFFDGTTPVGVSTLSGGLAAVAVSPTAAGTHHLTATFTPAPGFQASQTAGPTDLTVTPTAASQLAFTGQPGFALSGKYVRGPVSVSVEDKYGNVVTSSSAAVTVSLAGPGKSALAGTLTQPATSGVATFPNLKVTGHGPGFTLTAASPGLASATSLPFAVSDAVRFKVQVSAPVVAGQPFTLVVTAVDALGRVDPYYQGSVDLTGTGLTGQTTGTFGPGDRGKKKFTLTLPAAGKVMLTVTDALSAAVVGKLTVTVKA